MPGAVKMTPMPSMLFFMAQYEGLAGLPPGLTMAGMRPWFWLEAMSWFSVNRTRVPSVEVDAKPATVLMSTSWLLASVSCVKKE